VLVSMYYLRDCNVRLRSMQRMLEKLKDGDEDKVDFETITANFHGIAFDMANALSELANGSINHYGFSATLSLLTSTWESISAESTKEQFISAIENLTAPYEDFDYESPDLYSLTDTFRDTHHYESETGSPLMMDVLARAVKLNVPRVVNMLDARCRFGADAFSLVNSFSGGTMRAWGVGLAENSQESTRSRFHRVAMGALKGSNISNEAFDILLLRPDITLERSGEKLLFKKEKEMIHKAVNYVRTGGVVAIGLPYFRFYRDIVLFLSRNLSDIQIRRCDADSFSSTGLIYVVGIRKDDREIDEDGYTLMRHAFNYRNVPEASSNPLDEITLPNGVEEVKMFRGSVLDPEEIKRIYATSPCVTQFWRNQKVEKLSENAKNPLLPFNVGQLGLVLTSGCLDGVVDEGNGCCHVIKGRVVKKLDRTHDIDAASGQIEIVETTSNRVEINVFLPDGTHKILA
jgi:hypothetical protein